MTVSVDGRVHFLIIIIILETQIEFHTGNKLPMMIEPLTIVVGLNDRSISVSISLERATN
jgi:hypothetical protein